MKQRGKGRFLGSQFFLIMRGTRLAQDQSVTQRATVLAWIGTAGERSPVPIDPDRLGAAERADHAGGFMAELLEPFDDIGRHAVLELILALVVQAARHIDRLL